MWIELDVERILYVDRGRDMIVLDRYGSGAGTVILKLDEAAAAKLRRDIDSSSSVVAKETKP